jgi:anti-repressor protein
MIGFFNLKIMELIKVATNAEGKQVVSARDLHIALEVQKHFSQWIEPKLERFTNGIDFLTLELESTGGRPSTDYLITLDCAKLISMLQNNEVGDKVRKYFLECEKIAMQPKQLSRLEILTLALEAEKKVIELQEKIEVDKPKVEFAEQLLSATNSLDFGTSCKAMNLPFGRNRMFEICRKLNFIMHNNQPYQTYIDQGYFTLLETSYVNAKSGDRVLTTKTMITAKGQNWLIKNFKKNGLM